MTYKNFIDNEWQDAISGKKFGVFNPFTEEQIAEVPASNDHDIDMAVKAAKIAFEKWSGLTAGER